jgi:hypothetical protein
MISHEATPQDMPGEVFDFCSLESGVKCVLDVLNRLASLATRRVRESVRTLRNPLVVQRLQRCEHGRLERQCVRSATLGPLNTQDAVEEVHLIPSKVEQAASARGPCAQTG